MPAMDFGSNDIGLGWYVIGLAPVFWSACARAGVPASMAVVAAAAPTPLMKSRRSVVVVMETSTQSSLPSCPVEMSALRARCLVECGAQARGELDRVVIGPEMHEAQPRLLIQHVAVQCRHLDAVRVQRMDHRIDLLARHDEVAGDGGLAAAGRLEVDAGRNAQRPDRREHH